MVPKLRQAFEKLETLSDVEQEVLADQIIGVLAAEERKWDSLFSRPDISEALRQLADEALAEHRRGETRPLEELL